MSSISSYFDGYVKPAEVLAMKDARPRARSPTLFVLRMLRIGYCSFLLSSWYAKAGIVSILDEGGEDEQVIVARYKQDERMLPIWLREKEHDVRATRIGR